MVGGGVCSTGMEGQVRKVNGVNGVERAERVEREEERKENDLWPEKGRNAIRVGRSGILSTMVTQP